MIRKSSQSEDFFVIINTIYIYFTMKKYDSILYIDTPILEGDERMTGTLSTDATFHPLIGKNNNYDDPSMYNSFSFGRIVRNAISNMGQGWSAEVSDFKKWVVVNVKYHNYETSRAASKTFLIVFKMKGDGMILSTHNRYRTISGVDQAVSYINSSCITLRNCTQNRI